MSVSVAIATYNRAAEVDKTLATLAELKLDPDHDFEIIVVDNNSDDNTKEIVRQYLTTFGGHLRYVFENQQGLSVARNRAVDEAKFDIVAFLDDDVDVDPNWLCNLLAAYASGDIAGVGGRASLVFPYRRPSWLSHSIEGLLTKVELGPMRRQAGVGELYGVNMSFRKCWLRRAGGFRTDIGRMGKTLFGGEDDDMLERVAALGGQLLYEPDAAVGHRVPLNRLSRTWFWKRSYWAGSPCRELFQATRLPPISLLN